MRINSRPSSQFSAFDLIQQRNTFRLQYEHQVVKGGSLLGLASLPFIKEANLFSYYRFVYDSVYDIAPGARLRVNDGSTGERTAGSDPPPPRF